MWGCQGGSSEITRALHSRRRRQKSIDRNGRVRGTWPYFAGFENGGRELGAREGGGLQKLDRPGDGSPPEPAEKISPANTLI